MITKIGYRVVQDNYRNKFIKKAFWRPLLSGISNFLKSKFTPIYTKAVGTNWGPKGNYLSNIQKGVDWVTKGKTNIALNTGFGALDVLGGQTIPGAVGGVFGGSIGASLGGHGGAYLGHHAAKLMGFAPGTRAYNLATGAGRIGGMLFGGAKGYSAGATFMGGKTPEQIKNDYEYNKNINYMKNYDY